MDSEGIPGDRQSLKRARNSGQGDSSNKSQGEGWGGLGGLEV